MSVCFAVDCNHNCMRESCHFFRFPADKHKRRVWIDASRRADREPSSYSRLCSCHFKDGSKDNLPDIFAGNVEKRFSFTSPERRRKRAVKTPASSAASSSRHPTATLATATATVSSSPAPPVDAAAVRKLQAVKIPRQCCGAMALPCKRPRLSTDNDNHNDDDAVVVVDINDDDSATLNDVKVERSLTSGDDDDVKPCLESTESVVVDLTVQCTPPGSARPRGNFSHTAEVIKARYIRALQQFQRVSTLIDAVASQQMKLEARRDQLQMLMNALSTMYKVVKGHHRPSVAVSLQGSCDVATPYPADSHVTSSTSTDCYQLSDDLPVTVDTQNQNTIEDLSLADEKVPAAGGGYEQQRSNVGCCYYDGPSDTTLVTAHTTRNRVDVNLASLESPPPAHTAKVDITGCTYIVRNSCEAPDGV